MSGERAERTEHTRRPGAPGGQRPPRTARTPDDPQGLRQQAEAQLQRNAAALRAYPLPLAAEPAFVFRP